MASESPTDDRGAMLDHLEVAIDEAREKVESGRVYDPENEKIRIQWIRALAYCVDKHQKVMEHQELDEMKEQLELMKKAQGLDQ